VRKKNLNRATTKILLAVLATAMTISVANANAVTQWGDFTVKGPGSVIPVDAWAFDTEYTNPAGFPEPSKAWLISLYPGLFKGSLKVYELRDFYTSQGVPNDTFALLWKIGRKDTPLSFLVVKIGHKVAAEANVFHDGFLKLPACSETALLTNINLNDYRRDCKITILYGDGLCPKIEKVQFAATPEPISMAFLGTGFLATLVVRARRKKKS